MPANVSVEYAQAVEKYERAATSTEKMVALQEMKSTAPKHKGAEKLRAEISKKIAKLKKDSDKQRTQEKKRGSAPGMSVKKEGGGQVIIVGMPNSGKSTLLKELTGIDVAIDSYPFTTTKPEIGMMNYKGALVQLAEAPAIVDGSSKGKANGIQILSIIRNADALVLVLRENQEEEILVRELNNANIKINKSKPDIIIKPTKFKGITIAGQKHLKIGKDKLIEFLKDMGIFNANIILNEDTTLEKMALVLDEKIVYKKALILNTKDERDTEKLKGQIFSLLGKIIVYTKKPGGSVEKEDPLALKMGSTIEDVAKELHKDFARKLKYAKVWGSAKFPGQRVSKEYELKTGDIVEISA